MKITDMMVEKYTNVAFSIFEIKVNVIIKEEESFNPGEYDFKTDDIVLNNQAINDASDQLGVSIDDVVKHTICHETGHAKEARILAQENIFPYVFRTHRDSSLSINSWIKNTNGFKNQIQFFLNSMSDYIIDKNIFEHGIVDHILMRHINAIKQDINDGAIFDLRLKIQNCFNLFTYLNAYDHGGFQDKEIIKEYVIKSLGQDLWDNVSIELSIQSLTNKVKHKELVSDFLKNIFNISTEWKKISREEKSIPNSLPDFWDSSSYYLLHLN